MMTQRLHLAATLLGLLITMWCLVGCRPRSPDPPHAEPGRFAVVVADLEGDDDSRRMKALLTQELLDLSSQVPTLQILDVREPVEVSDSNVPEEAIRRGHDNARALLEQTGASMVFWGRVQGVNEQSKKAVLYVTTGPKRRGEGQAQHYVPGTELMLPEEFWEHLGDILAMVVVVESFDYAQQGQYLVERVVPFIEKVEGLRESKDFRDKWSPDSRAQVDFVLGYCWDIVASQAGDTQAGERAVAVYRSALEVYTRERVPLQWAMTQNNLGAVLQALGEREEGVTRLEESVAAYRGALEILTRERVPLLWAAIQNNLGNALHTLGEREQGVARLEEAVAAYRSALEVYTRERVPLDWAMTQNNLGAALAALGEREQGAARLEEAVTAYRAALEVRTSERVPLQWAGTQYNLGIAFLEIAARTNDMARLCDCLSAFSNAWTVLRNTPCRQRLESSILKLETVTTPVQTTCPDIDHALLDSFHSSIAP